MAEPTTEFRELMELHIAAMFTVAEDGALCTVNRAWDNTQPAPRFFLGVTADNDVVYRFRRDVPREIRDEIEQCDKAGLACKNILAGDGVAGAYANVLDSQNHVTDLCYLVPHPSAQPDRDCILFAREHESLLADGEAARILDAYADTQPCAALLHAGRVVSVCQSVRKSNQAHEAGVETVTAHRGNGHAGRVLSHWASAVYEAGRLPLYTVSVHNKPSIAVAEKAGLLLYGCSVYVY